MQATNIILGIVIVGLLLSNALSFVIIYKLVEKLSTKIMAGTLDNYAEKISIVSPKREKPLVHMSLKDKSDQQPESAFADGDPVQYADLDELPPEKSLEALKKFTEENAHMFEGEE